MAKIVRVAFDYNKVKLYLDEYQDFQIAIKHVSKTQIELISIQLITAYKWSPKANPENERTEV